MRVTGRGKVFLHLFPLPKTKIQSSSLNIYKIFKNDRCTCHVPASIAVVLPQHLSGIFLKPLRAWDYPNKLPFVPKRRCLLVLIISIFAITFLPKNRLSNRPKHQLFFSMRERLGQLESPTVNRKKRR